MDFSTLSPARRTIRRFEQRIVPDEMLKHLIDMARFASCASNKQRLRYVIIRENELVRKVFETTAWAGMVAPKRTPKWGIDAPLDFIAVTAPVNAGEIIHADAGAAIQSIQLAAWECGLGCCWFASFKKAEVTELLNISPDREILYLIAVGFPAENPVGEKAVDGDVAYYLDENDVLHVPKLPVDELCSWM
ncbi:MAG: nitroreductase family protein [Lentisphaeria bacterium]|nr:nitroreductase family protein [Lentisphaeria bacterium]